jgi:secondary thiamine-phosphate synthase enzyme
MPVKSLSISFNTRGETDILDITDEVAGCVQDSGLNDGIATLFSPSSTSGLTTIEYERGAIDDLKRLFDEIVPTDRYYKHNERWGDGNGYSHVRAALLKASLTIPFVSGRLTLGTWQQIVYIDFDNRSRRRTLVIQLIGE